MWRLLTLVGWVTLAGCGPTSKTVIEQPASAPAVDTTLDVGDTFDVKVYGEADLSGTYRVSPEGSINMPLAGLIKVQGLDQVQAAKRIAERLTDGLIRNPQVIVSIKELASKKIYIIGQVSKPGTFSYTPLMNVLEAITGAGGFTPLAAKNDTTITRAESGKKTIVKVPVEEIGEGKAKNVYLKPGDIINVPERIF
jgi:protein involved in polysaccharide export with SLBB domain